MEKNKEEIIGWIEKLREAGKLVIVEGEKDIRALNHFGIKSVMELKKPLYAVVEEIASMAKEVVILTDFDKKGKELYGRLSKDLAKHGVKVDRYFREFLQKNTRLSHIEGLRTYINNMG